MLMQGLVEIGIGHACVGGIDVAVDIVWHAVRIGIDAGDGIQKSRRR
jgi:hypothetical protein